jgi:hypothetical protein
MNSNAKKTENTAKFTEVTTPRTSDGEPGDDLQQKTVAITKPLKVHRRKRARSPVHDTEDEDDSNHNVHKRLKHVCISFPSTSTISPDKRSDFTSSSTLTLIQPWSTKHKLCNLLQPLQPQLYVFFTKSNISVYMSPYLSYPKQPQHASTSSTGMFHILLLNVACFNFFLKA